ncbi:pyridoxamine 5'-phosphate oxidase [Flavobacterium sp. NST-5]|uniref:Pyridoxine/pyridoxamine 5'-phosphate oxidase n=1 Tax=Flavobacterium ichthyis TaxID=2698827 RepID=A0ABW9ZAD5_9FLAO|nr:pyridoxamine 5'-phosphate oxidase [Flavobacterium ichthyis]NBL65111.1 pyridoxamine 5'-phosphate oxidase [Flavobacterium ichthyis]
MKDLSNYRKSYEKSQLVEDTIPQNPFQLFTKWFHEAEQLATSEEVNAMTISTNGLDGFPKSRIVLLKQFSQEGFVFYTNYLSEKGLAIANDPRVCLSFFWAFAERQVIIKGEAKKVSADVSDQYFQSRPKGSQIGAVVSKQSEIIPSRNFIEEKAMYLENVFKDEKIIRPEHWGGYIVEPVEIEFWQGRSNRLHDRIRFRKDKNDWIIARLSP